MAKLDPVGTLQIALIVGAGVAVYLIATRAFKTGEKIVDAAKGVITKDLNPASSDNIVNRAVSAVGGALTGQDDFSLGSWIYDITHKDYNPSNVQTQAKVAAPTNNRVAPGFDPRTSRGLIGAQADVVRERETNIFRIMEKSGYEKVDENAAYDAHINRLARK